MRSVDHFISGKTVKSGSGRFSDIYNPNTGEVQAQVGLANDAEVDQAVDVLDHRLLAVQDGPQLGVRAEGFQGDELLGHDLRDDRRVPR